MTIKKIGSFGIDKLKTVLNTFNNKVPKIIANEVKNHFLEGFRQGGKQTNESRGGWTARSTRARRNQGRALLVDTGALRGDILTRQVSPRRIVVGTRNVPYSVYINEGTDKMPKREFIGESTALELKIKRIIEKGLENIKR